MSLATLVAAYTRRPSITLYLDGRRAIGVLTARVGASYGSGGVAGGTVVLRSPPVEPVAGMAIRWSWGYDGYEVPGFTGYVTRVLDSSYPDRYELAVQDVLWLAVRESTAIATVPLNSITATAAISYILATYGGDPRTALPAIKRPSDDTVNWTLGALTPVSWSRSSALAAAQEIAVAGGYWLYADAGGTVRATRIERAPSDSPFRTFQRGVNLLVSGAPTRAQDWSQVRNRVTVRGANTGVESAQLFDTFSATHALSAGVTAEHEYSTFLLEYIADVTAVASRLTALYNRRPNTISARIKADPRLSIGATIAIEDSGVGYASAQSFFIYGLETTLDTRAGRFDQALTLDGGLGDGGYTEIPNPIAVLSYQIERETIDGTAVTVISCDGSGSVSLAEGAIVSWEFDMADTPYSGTPAGSTAPHSSERFAFVAADTEAPFSVTLLVTDTTSKTGTVTVAIPLSGDAVGAQSEALIVAAGAAASATPDGGATWYDEVRTVTLAAEGAGVWPDAPASDAASYGALISSGADVRRTLDLLGTTSTLMDTAGASITALYTNPRNAARAWRGVGVTLQRSLDGGDTWGTWGTLPASINCVIEDPALDHSVFVAAGANVYHSTSVTAPGATWSTLYAGPSGATARWVERSDDGQVTWVAYTGTFVGSPLQRIEGPISVTFPVMSPAAEVEEIRAVALTHETPPRVAAVDQERRCWVANGLTGLTVTQGPTLPAGGIAQHATASREVPSLVYIADFDSVTAATTGALRKWLLGSGSVLLPARLGPAGRQYHQVRVASSAYAARGTMYLLPWGAAGAADYIFRWRDGVYAKIAPPLAGRLWTNLAVNPLDRTRLLLTGIGTTNNVLDVYLSTNGGTTWSVAVNAEARDPGSPPWAEWSGTDLTAWVSVRQNGGVSRLLRGSSTTVTTITLSPDASWGHANFYPGLSGEVFTASNPGNAGNGVYGYIDASNALTAGTVITALSIYRFDRKLGARKSISTQYPETAADRLRVNADYQLPDAWTALSTMPYAAYAALLADGSALICQYSAPTTENGMGRITDPHGTPAVTTEAYAGQRMYAVRTDRATGTVAAALIAAGGSAVGLSAGAHTPVIRSAAGVWTTVPRHPDMGTLAPFIEVTA